MATDPLHDTKPARTDLVVGTVFVVISLLIAFVWIPFDIESGVFEKIRRRIEIGDAFAPALTTALLGVGGLLLIIEALRNKSVTRLSAPSLIYAAGLLVGFLVFIALLRWTGPVLVALAAAEGSEYRLLRDTFPWKYSGFLLGGTFLVSGLIGFVEQRLTLRAVAIGLLSALGMILLYDLPFDDLLLPPNGDF